MVYKYSPEVEARFKEVDECINVDLKKTIELYLKIAEDYSYDEAVLAKAYYGAGNVYNLLSDIEQSEKYCRMAVEAGKNSGNTRCQVLATIMLALLKLSQMNDALAADYLFEAFSLAIKNKDEDVLNTIYTLLAQIFEAAESYDNALEYHQKGIDGFAEVYVDAKDKYLSTYGARILCKGICGVSAKRWDVFKDCYCQLVELHFEKTMPVYRVSMIFMDAVWYYIEGDHEKAIALFLRHIDEMQQLDEILDTYELLTHTYSFFEELHLLDYQKKVVDLMKHYAKIINVWKCKEQCNHLEVRYYTQIGDKEKLYEALLEYHQLQEEYRSDHMKQRRANLTLRKQLFEAEEAIRNKISTLEYLSEKDALTDIANRKGLEHFKNDIFMDAIAKNECVGVVLIDVDKYKGYNDTYGHLKGDECLKTIASIMKKIMGAHFCARYGGDEFIVLFVGEDEKTVHSSLLRLKEAILEVAMEHEENSPYGIVTLSQGAVVRKAREDDTFETLVLEADQNLYKCKEKGRNVIVMN